MLKAKKLYHFLRNDCLFDYVVLRNNFIKLWFRVLFKNKVILLFNIH